MRCITASCCIITTKTRITCYEQAGFYAFTAIKYVYRGIDTVDGNDTVTNLQKLQEALAQCTDIVATPDTEVPAAPAEASNRSSTVSFLQRGNV